MSLAYDFTWLTPGTNLWVDGNDQSDEGDAFLQAKVKSYDSSIVEAEIINGSTVSLKPHQVHQRSSHVEDFDDMINMEVLNDAELLENIRIRFVKDKIFTYVGPTLIVINPFKKLPHIISEQLRLQYIKHIIPAVDDALAYKQLSPHVYALASEAYRSLFENQKNQAIVISGESGAGKTENAKFCMSLLTTIGQTQNTTRSSNTEDDRIEEKILSCNPILEAFGNAKTKRNNNSSRFGKYVRIIVDPKDSKIQGAQIVNYLLEKSRITSQSLEERNFHIFYHFIEGLSQVELQKYCLLDEKQNKLPYDWFQNLKKSQNYVSPGINDKELFEEIKDAINNMGMKEYEDEIFSVISATLLLGNIHFDASSFGNNSACVIKQPKLFAQISALLGVNNEKFQFNMTYKSRTINKVQIDSPLTDNECMNGRDSLAKELYERLFNWIVRKLNDTIRPKNQGNFVSIGLLDIYGFEVFLTNSLEQLMINYTNEKLHQLYISYEQKVFMSEGLEQFLCEIKFKDNTPVIEILDKTPLGVFLLLDESCQVTSSDESLVQKIRQQHKGNTLLKNPKMIGNPSFIIVHTAKEVEYTITGFRAKNKDETAQMLLEFIGSSSSNLLKEVFAKTDVKGEKFLGSKLRKELVELMKELNSCDCHFIRCIKPNELKQPNIFSQNMTLNQIRYLGVLDSLKVRKDSYPIRRTFKMFYKQFGDMGNEQSYPIILEKQADFQPFCQRLIKDKLSHIPDQHLLIGKTKIFMRIEGIQEVQNVYDLTIKKKNISACLIQKNFKSHKLRKGIKLYMKFVDKLKRKAKALLCKLRFKKFIQKVKKIQQFYKRRYLKIMIQKTKMQAQVVQKYMKRVLDLKMWTACNKKIIQIQNFARFIKNKNYVKKYKFVKSCILSSLTKAWHKILNIQALKIQKKYRGYITRKKIGKKILKQIRDAGRYCQLNKNAVTYTRVARGYLVRKRIRHLNNAAFFIQGYFKMKILSRFFQQLRVKIVILQRNVRDFLERRARYNTLYEIYVMPWEKTTISLKQFESDNLIGSKVLDYLHSKQLIANKCQLSYFVNDNDQNRQITTIHEDMKFIMYARTLQCAITIEQIMEEDLNFLGENKLTFINIVVDLEILTDLTQIYSRSWALTYKTLLLHSVNKRSPLMLVQVTETSTIASLQNGQVFMWGSDFADKRIPEIYQEIMNLPTQIRHIKNGENHLLIQSTSGKLYGYGMTQEGQLGPQIKEFISCPKPICSKEEIIDSDCKGTYSFIVNGNNEAIWYRYGHLIKLKIGYRQLAEKVHCGYNFTIIQTTNGLMWSLGDNNEGQLGLGDNEKRQEPNLVTKLAHHAMMQISCGFKHVLVQTKSGKVFTWGWGCKGQLGLRDYNNQNQPKELLFDNKTLQIIAGHKCSLIINDHQQILWTGTNATITHQSVFSEFQINGVLGHSKNYIPLRVHCSWSRSLSIINVTFANVASFQPNKFTSKQKHLQQMTQKWGEQGNYNIHSPNMEHSFFGTKQQSKSNANKQTRNIIN